MNKRVAGAIGLAVALGGAAITRQDFRDGRSRFWLSGGIIPLEARRSANPGWFWAWTAINSALIAVIIVGGLLAMLLP